MTPPSPSTTTDPARRWASVPGVTYPTAPAGATHDPHHPIPTTPPPVPTVTTADAAALLGIKPSSAHAFLDRHNIPSWLRRDADNIVRRYWSRSAVVHLLRSHRTIDPIPTGYCDAREALAILGTCRSNLHRFAARGTITQLLLLRPRPTGGTQRIAYYPIAELHQLAAIRASRAAHPTTIEEHVEHA